MAEGGPHHHQYNIHLVVCGTDSNCACLLLMRRLYEDLKRENLTIAFSVEDYPLAGSRSQHFTDFAERSEITVIPLCSNAENLEESVQRASKFRQRFSVVTCEKVQPIPPFLVDYFPTLLDIPGNTTAYTKYLGGLIKSVTKGWTESSISQVNPPPPLRIPQTPSQSIQCDERINEDARNSIFAIHSWSGSSVISDSSLYSRSDSSQNYQLEEFVSLITLTPPSTERTSKEGPFGKQKFTEVIFRRKHMKDFETGDFPTTFNASPQKTEKIIFLRQILCHRTLGQPICLVAKLLDCKIDGCLRQHCLTYIECALFKYDIHARNMMEESRKNLLDTEKAIFSCIAKHRSSEEFARSSCMYVLFLALITAEHGRAISRELFQRITFLQEQKFEDSLGKNVMAALIELIKSTTREIGGTAGPMQFGYRLHKSDLTIQQLVLFHELLQNVAHGTQEESFRQLHALLSKLFQAKTTIKLFKLKRNTTLILLRLLYLRGILTAIRNQSGEGNQRSYKERTDGLLKALEIVMTKVDVMETCWAELMYHELRPLLFHISEHVRVEIRRLGACENMTVEQYEALFKKHIVDILARAGFSIRGRASEDINKIQAERSEWKHYEGTIGGALTPVSILYHQPLLGQLVAQKNDDEDTPMYDYDIEGQLYKNECHVLHKLGSSSDSIVKLLGFQITPYPFLYVLEQPIGNTLLACLLEKRRTGHWLPLPVLTNIAISIIEALDFCKEKNIAHRDIRTCNFYMMDVDISRGVTKLANFEQARFLISDDNGSQSVIENDSTYIPTLWSSPESLLEDKYSTMSDMWMLGHTLIELYTHGCWPYSKWLLQEKKLKEVMAMVVHNRLNPSEPTGLIPGSLFNIILGCFERVEKNRPCPKDILSSFETFLTNNCDLVSETGLGIAAPTSGYPRLSSYQQKCKSIPDKGIPYGLKFIDPTPDHEGPGVGPWQEPAEDGPLLLPSGDSLVIQETPLYEHRSDELKILSGLDNAGLLKCHKYIKEAQGTFLMITECPLRCARRLSEEIHSPQITVDICLEIFTTIVAALMALHAQKCVHRDICLEHILFDTGTNKAFLFRFARVRLLRRDGRSFRKPIDQYIIDPREAFFNRLRWFPQEVIREGKYTMASDIYMFAVTVWEAFNILSLISKKEHGSIVPFENISSDKLIDHIASGKILPKPDLCPPWLYNVLRRCWDPQGCRRPSLANVKTCFELRKCILRVDPEDFVERRFLKVGPRGQKGNVYSEGNYEHLHTERIPPTAVRPVTSDGKKSVHFNDNIELRESDCNIVYQGLGNSYADTRGKNKNSTKGKGTVNEKEKKKRFFGRSLTAANWPSGEETQPKSYLVDEASDDIDDNEVDGAGAPNGIYSATIASSQAAEKDSTREESVPLDDGALYEAI